MRVLAIEDGVVAAAQLEAAIRAVGHEPVSVGDGDEAWQYIQESTFRIVVSDWQLPGADGLELCRRIRARPGEYVYFILISVTAITRQTREAALAAGVDDFLAKPIDPDELGMRLRVAERILGLTAKVERLESFLPICSYCKKVRDDRKFWQEIESYISDRNGTRFSHGVCPHCYDQFVAPQVKELGLDLNLPPENLK